MSLAMLFDDTTFHQMRTAWPTTPARARAAGRKSTAERVIRLVSVVAATTAHGRTTRPTFTHIAVIRSFLRYRSVQRL
jgi:hypothetical protein